jgi:competence protein ComEA
MGKIRFWLNRYFGFSRRETNGFFLLLLITFLAGVAPFLLYTNSPPQQLSRDQAELDSLVAQLERHAARQPAADGKRKSGIRPRRQPLKSFNPNVLSREDWLALGLSSYAAANILKYRERAGGFRYKEQLARIYGLPPELYRELAPFIDLPSRTPRAAATASTRPPRSYYREKPSARNRLTAFDINTADTVQLKKIRGIGSRLSRRIIRFRDKLGGFAHINQLREVYGLPPEAADSLQKYVFIQEGFRPQQIPLNTAALQELQAHPYLGYRTARLILAYRTQHGPFQSLEDLSRIHQISAEQLNKLRPYLRL